MGSNQSAPIEARAVTAQQVSAYLISENSAFEKYSRAIIENKISGEFLIGLNEIEFEDILKEINVERAIHRRTFKMAFTKFHEFASSNVSSSASSASSSVVSAVALLPSAVSALSLSNAATAAAAASPLPPYAPLLPLALRVSPILLHTNYFTQKVAFNALINYEKTAFFSLN